MALLAAFAVPHPPLIIPAVGKGEERGIQATIDAYREVGRRICNLAPQTIVVSSPHSVMYRDYLHISPGAGAKGSFASFGAPQARYQASYDQNLVAALCAAADADGLAAGTEGERDPRLDHATMIPLHFIQEAYAQAGRRADYQVVRMGLSGLGPQDHYHLGQLVQKVTDVLGRRVVFVASGDLSHKLSEDGPYGFAPEGPRFDQAVCDAFSKGDFLSLLTLDRSLADRAAECGLRSFQIMAGALDQTPVRPELLSYEGPFGVGYGVASFTPAGPEGSDPSRAFLDLYQAWRRRDMRRRKEAEGPLVKLARLAVERYVLYGERTRADSPFDLALLEKPLPDGALRARAGCFVSIKEEGDLRGCIGTIAPTKASLAQEICDNAVSACAHDPRFPAVREEELGSLVYSVDVLEAPEPIGGLDLLDPARYGVIVSTGDGRRGLLLPDLDGVDTATEQVRIAARKGGIDLARDDWSLERFEVVRHT